MQVCKHQLWLEAMGSGIFSTPYGLAFEMISAKNLCAHIFHTVSTMFSKTQLYENGIAIFTNTVMHLDVNGNLPDYCSERNSER